MGNESIGDDNLLSEWHRIELLGTGGNGEVWKANKNGTELALKILSNTQPNHESYRRFSHEVTLLRQLDHEPGILPIVESHLPTSPSKKDRAWMSMPLATSIKTKLGERPLINEVVDAIASIAETLARLAQKGICHRDIKPENLYHFKNGWAIGDFGLADFPNKDDVTEEGRALGPRFYIAPEMVRDPIRSSGFPADVWSLAKTLWVLATGQNFPPPHPQPANDPSDSLAAQINHPHVRYLDNLIERATSKDPAMRPTMQEFAIELRSWLSAASSPNPAHDVSEVTSQIRLLSGSYYDTQSRIVRCREEAILLTQRVQEELMGLYSQMKESALPCNEPAGSGKNLLEGSGLAPCTYGEHGAIVSMYTPSPVTHIYQCGVLIQVLNDRTHRLYAAHQIRHNDGTSEVVWSECHEVDAGSSQEHRTLKELIVGLYGNLRLGLERFAEIMA